MFTLKIITYYTQKLSSILFSPVLAFVFTLLLFTPLIHAQEQTQDNPSNTENTSSSLDRQHLYILYTPTLLMVPFISNPEDVNDSLDSNNTYTRLAHALSIRYTNRHLLLQFSYIPTEDIANTDRSFYISQALQFSIGAHYPIDIIKNAILFDVSIAAALSVNFAGYNKKNNIDSISEKFTYYGIGLHPNLLFDFSLSKDYGIVAGIDGVVQYIPLGGVSEKSVFTSNNKIQAIFTMGTTIGFYIKF